MIALLLCYNIYITLIFALLLYYNIYVTLILVSLLYYNICATPYILLPFLLLTFLRYNALSLPMIRRTLLRIFLKLSGWPTLKDTRLLLLLIILRSMKNFTAANFTPFSQAFTITL